MAKKALRAKTKAKIQIFVNYDTDQHCYQSNWPMQTIAVKAQTYATKDLQLEKPKVWSAKLTILSALSWFNNFKFFAKAW